MNRPTSIRIFLADGRPDGVRIVEKSNWTGRAVVASRTELSHAFAREEMQRPGVYVLAGVGDEGDRLLYVGEADVLKERLRNHNANKDFWTWFVAFTSTDQNLNKAHVRYLESKLVALAKRANQWTVENGNEPNEPPLSEADRADADWFLDEMLVIYPILGIDAFEIAGSDEVTAEDEVLYLDERGGEGRGREVADGFIVLAGSLARTQEVPSAGAWLTDLRRQLLNRGVLRHSDDHLLFTQDFRFSSPSQASSVLVGGNSNGRRAWAAEDGRTLKQLQEERAE